MTEDILRTKRWRKLRKEVLAHEHTCYLCGRPIDMNLPPTSAWSATVDHVVARANDADLSYSASNLHAAHRWCNSHKGSLTLEEYRYRQAMTAEHSRAW